MSRIENGKTGGALTGWGALGVCVALVSVIGSAAAMHMQGSHGHEISGKVLKLENTISSTGNVLE